MDQRTDGRNGSSRCQDGLVRFVPGSARWYKNGTVGLRQCSRMLDSVNMHDAPADVSNAVSSTNTVSSSSTAFEGACCDESIASTVERVMRTILKNDSCKSSNTKVLSSAQKRKGLSIAARGKRVAKSLNDFEFVEFEPIDTMSSSGTAQSCPIVQPTSAPSRKEQHQQHHCASTAATTGTCSGSTANGTRDSQRCPRPATEVVVDEVEQHSKAKRRKRDKSEAGKSSDSHGESIVTTTTNAAVPSKSAPSAKAAKGGNKSKCKRPLPSPSNDDAATTAVGAKYQSDDTDVPKAKRSKKYEKRSGDIVEQSSVSGRVEDGNNRDKREPSTSAKCGVAAKSSPATKATSSRCKRQENEKAAGVPLPTSSTKVPHGGEEKAGGGASSHATTTTTVTTTTRRIQFVRSNENAIADFELVDVRLQEAYAHGLVNSGTVHNGGAKRSGSTVAGGGGTASSASASTVAATPTTTTTATTTKPRRPAPSPVVTLALRAIVPRGLMPNETCILYANVHVKPNALCGVELHVYGNGDLHTCYETSLLDGKRGGLTVCLQNLSSAYKNIGVGDIIGYLELRALDETMKLSV